MSSTYVKQEGGAHYQGVDKQHWDLMEEFDVAYLEAQVSKYLLRWRRKGGVGDLRKALTFIEKMLKCRQSQGARRLVPAHELDTLFNAMETEKRERRIISLILVSGSHDDVLTARMDLMRLISESE
jgi:hypothetical protein